MTYQLRGNFDSDIRRVCTKHRVAVRFKPFDGIGAGRIAYVNDGDLIEYIGENQKWFQIKSIIIETINNIRHFEGWICKDLASLKRGYTLADADADKAKVKS